MPDPNPPEASVVYRLRVVVAGVSPLIWRRLLVTGDTTIAGLHEVLQAALDWSGEHMHAFTVHGVEHGICYDYGPVFHDDGPGPPRRPRAAGGRKVRLRLQLHRRLAPRPTCRGHRCGRTRHDVPALHWRAPRWPTGGLGRAVGLPGTNPAVPDLPGDRAGGRDLGRAVRRRPRHHRRRGVRRGPPRRAATPAPAARSGLFRPAGPQPDPRRTDHDGKDISMRVTVSVTIQPDGDGAPAVAGDVFTCERTSPLAPDTVGLHLDEAKALLTGVQDTMVAAQARAAVAENAVCPGCGAARRHKDTRQIVVRTLYGVLRLDSPRWRQCGCTPHAHATISPLTALLPERATPELMYLEAKFAALASYGASANLLGELLPLGRRLHATAIRFHTRAVAQRLEDELGDEQAGFIDTCPRDWQRLPRPDLPLVVGLDGGYVHSAAQRSRRDGWFEVIAGKAVPAQGRPQGPGIV